MVGGVSSASSQWLHFFAVIGVISPQNGQCFVLLAGAAAASRPNARRAADRGAGASSSDGAASRNSSQCLHFFAVARIVSPQYGQSLVSDRFDESDARDNNDAGGVVERVELDGVERGLDVAGDGGIIMSPQPGHFTFLPAR